MRKDAFVKQILATLSADLALFTDAAKSAHAAATHEECAPDNKYDTTALEASYIAQGQANRAQDVRQALERYRALELRAFNETSPVRLTALVTLEDDDGRHRQLFLGPAAGGMKLSLDGTEVVVITPESPLGKALLGKQCDDEVTIGSGKDQKTYCITDII